MKTVEGKYTTAKVFTDNVEDYALAQIKMLCDNEVFKDCKVRVMPDVHPGKVGPIGFTSTVGDKIMPYVVGSDIGCGITLALIDKKKIEFQKLDTVIREHIPTGFNIRNTHHKFYDRYVEGTLKFRCQNYINMEKAKLSLGTLGGGNHFIEVNTLGGDLFVSIHSGSRHLGQEITEYYMKEGQKQLKAKGIDIPYELTYLEGKLMEDYIHDSLMAVHYAGLNRNAILNDLEKYMKFKIVWYSDCTHNYINLGGSFTNNIILRKGSISAYDHQTVIIPINMKEGIILGTGLGNHDWNYSAPHGSGRIMNRENVKSNFTVNQFKKEMNGIYCSCIGKDTLDEAPFAYRGLEEIKEAISETVRIDKILKPVYNYKAGSKEK